MTHLDDYIRDVIAKGDDGSKLLAGLTASTLKNPIDVGSVRVLNDGMNGLAVLDVPKDYSVVVHSCGGDITQPDMKNYTRSLVDNLVSGALPGSHPVAFANVVDSNKGDIGMIETIGKELNQAATRHNLAILNGENAVLGDRVSSEANLSGTMISLIPTSEIDLTHRGEFQHCGTHYAIFDPKGKPVTINSDGVGTKTDFYERSGQHRYAVLDFLAMNLDDAIKIGAQARVISGVLELGNNDGNPRERISEELINFELFKFTRSQNMLGILQPENLTGRMAGYKAGVPTYNISGSVVSTIDEERLANPLKPNEGDYIIGIRSERANPRSNGITARRQLMGEIASKFDPPSDIENWHTHPQGERYLKFLASPSTIFYPHFKQLIANEMATSVYHMSGGAFDGKLARPLAKEELYAELSNLFEMNGAERALVTASGASAHSAFQNWPMRTEALVTTQNPDAVLKYFSNPKLELEARVYGRLESGKTGVKINTPNGEVIRYTGLD